LAAWVTVSLACLPPAAVTHRAIAAGPNAVNSGRWIAPIRHAPSATTMTGSALGVSQRPEQAHLRRAALARYLGLTTGYVSQLEGGSKQANGPAFAWLNVIHRKGVDVLL
jgi:DNA-binding transcriptional regulator YiaG